MAISSARRRLSVEEKILTAIERHKTLPSAESVADLVPGLHRKRVLDARQANESIASAFDNKTIKIARKMTLQQLLEPRAFIICSRFPDLVEHRKNLISERIATFSGRPTLVELARHVTGKPNRAIFRGDEAIRKLAVSKLVSLLEKTPVAEIQRQRLDRNADPAVRRYLNQRLGRKKRQY